MRGAPFLNSQPDANDMFLEEQFNRAKKALARAQLTNLDTFDALLSNQFSFLDMNSIN